MGEKDDFVLREMLGQISVEWTINNFCSLAKDKGYSIESPTFLLSDATWYIKLFSCEGLNAQVYLKRKSSYSTKHRVNYKFVFKTENTNLHNTRFLVHDFINEYSPVVFVNRVLISKHGSLPVVKLIILCSAWVLNTDSLEEDSSKLTSQPELQKMPLPEGIEALTQDFGDLLVRGSKADVTIRVRGQEFQAHGLILAARSQVFAAIFENDIDGSSKLIDIDDCDPTSFNDVLLYLYTGKVDQVTGSNALELYKTADKYGLKALKKECVQCMSSNMSVNTFCDFLLIADVNKEEGLKQTATYFFIEHLKEILVSSNWKLFHPEHHALANELFLTVANYIKK